MIMYLHRLGYLPTSWICTTTKACRHQVWPSATHAQPICPTLKGNSLVSVLLKLNLLYMVKGYVTWWSVCNTYWSASRPNPHICSKSLGERWQLHQLCVFKHSPGLLNMHCTEMCAIQSNSSMYVMSAIF